MNKQEILRLCKQAGLVVEPANFGSGFMVGLSRSDAVENLIILVREECAARAEKYTTMEGYEKEIADDIRNLWETTQISAAGNPNSTG